MSSTLVYSEREAVRLELLAGAREIARARQLSVAVALLGPGSAERAEVYFAHGAEQVFVAEDSMLGEQQTDACAQALAQIATQAEADLVLIGSTRRGRALAPRLAQKMEAGSVTEALGLAVHEGRLLVRRYSLGGNTVREVAITSPKAVIAVVPGTFEVAQADAKVDGAVVRVPMALTASRARVVEHKKKQVGAANIEQAERVVCIGRGVEKREDLQIIEALVKALEGELAGTRPLAYEFGWIPEDRMIGISGKAVRPQLYVAVGLSGQIQHAASIRGSKVILVINKDKSAPIFAMADYGIVGDLYEVVPRLTQALQRGP
ncbi:MAG: electron transfer flavoprotein subunit alpha/FixB family protein [Chloroflexi bacterium]|jgi:electron transfer flavoprotein alpha subunit|nr:electron transfer flavoprotein subunit alpha/FixB family protein [Chloroflexota bacterium]